MKKILFFFLLIFVFVSGYSSSYAASKSKSYDKSSSVHELLCEAGIDSVTLTVNGVTATTTCAPAVAGKCGTADGKPSSSAPSGPSLCEKGDASAVSESGSWTWYCAGTNGGGKASCDAPKQKYTITAKANPTTGGSVSPTSQTVNHGGVALVNATAVSGYKFDGWTGCTSVSGTTCTVSNVTSNKTVTASFKKVEDPTKPSCGSADGTPIQDKPTNGLCEKGDASAVILSGSLWKWGCTLGTKSVACSADVACGEYTESWSVTWTDCDIGYKAGNKWDTNGQITCRQTATIKPNKVLDSKFQPNCAEDAEYPIVTTPDIKTISLTLTPPSTPFPDLYANNTDIYTYKLTLNGATNGNKPVINWGDNNKLTDFQDATDFKADVISKTGKALTITPNPSSIIIPNQIGNFSGNLKITSVTPFKKPGDISFKAGTTQLTIKSIPYHFKKPFVGIIKTYDFLAKNWDGKPTIGTIGKFNLIVQKSSALSLLSLPLPGYTLNDFKDKIGPLNTTLKVAAQKVDLSTLTQATGTQFEARIDTSDAKITKLPTPGLQVNLPVISYTLGGKDVSYYLSANDEGTDTTPISTTGKAFIGIKIIGGLQGQGKQEITGQKANISNLYTFNQRTEIRKNAYTYVRGMSSKQVVNRVKYVEGDVDLSSRPSDYDTLVVINGNLTINGNIASSSNPFGIIVIQDAYDVNNTFSKKGNIYITPNVTKINAIIYSDGGIISATPSGQPYKEDSVTRTQELQNQLTIVGSVFTRNTIGGAISANGGKYLLPGGGVAPNFDQAMIYDFNYLRRGNEGCAKKSDGKTCVYEEPFILQYDSRILKNPPKLFSIGK